MPGLNAWKRQLLGKHDYELYRRLLKAAYKVRDAIKGVRNPWISITEQSKANQKVGEGTSGENNENHNKSINNVYSVRWQKVVEALSDLDAEFLDAEISWGEDVTKTRDDLSNCIKKLYLEIYTYLNKLSPHPKMPQDKIVNYDVIYDSINGNDLFSMEIKKSIEKIKVFLEPHLKIKN